MKCRPGYYYVKKHYRISSNGNKHIVGDYCRKNSTSKKNILFKSNLHYLFAALKKKYSYKKIKRIKNHSKDQGQYDEIIQFWIQYWTEKKILNAPIDPLLIKAIIAVESNFREKVITKDPKSTAAGLMQVLKSTLPILKGKPQKSGYREISSGNIELSYEELKDPISNIAAGLRWLFYKIESSPKRKSTNYQARVRAGIKFYHSWDEDGEAYAKKVYELYNKSK